MQHLTNFLASRYTLAVRPAMRWHMTEWDRIIAACWDGVLARFPALPYSNAMKNSGFIWDEKTLDRFLTQPMKVLPGTTMTYAGIPDSKERSDLIAYLKQANDSRECHSLRALPH